MPKCALKPITTRHPIPLALVPLEKLAAATLKGLAAQIIGLDYSDPHAFEMAEAKLDEMASVLDRVKDHHADLEYFRPLSKIASAIYAHNDRLELDGSGAREV